MPIFPAYGRARVAVEEGGESTSDLDIMRTITPKTPTASPVFVPVAPVPGSVTAAPAPLPAYVPAPVVKPVAPTPVLDVEPTIVKPTVIAPMPVINPAGPAKVVPLETVPLPQAPPPTPPPVVLLPPAPPAPSLIPPPPPAPPPSAIDYPKNNAFPIVPHALTADEQKLAEKHYLGVHPNWDGVGHLFLRGDGTFDRLNEDMPGAWGFDGTVLTIAWRDYPPEQLKSTAADHFISDANGFQLIHDAAADAAPETVTAPAPGVSKPDVPALQPQPLPQPAPEMKDLSQETAFVPPSDVPSAVVSIDKQEHNVPASSTNTGQTPLLVVGAGAGFLLGGPVGAAIGGGVGLFLGRKSK